MLTAQHFEYCVHAFAVSQVLDGLFVVALPVIYSVLQTKFFNACELVVGRRSPVHFYAQQFSNLHRGGSDASSYGVDQYAFWVASNRIWFAYESRLPEREVCGEVIDWERSPFFRTPIVGDRPQQFGSGGNEFRKCAPSGIAHYPATVAVSRAAELPACDQRGFRSARIPSLSRHNISEVQAAGHYLNQWLSGARRWVRNISNLENFGPS